MQTVARLSPKRPLRFNELSASHHASGGAEVFPDYLNIALRRNDINDKLLSHELANLLIELQHDYLAISDRIPRGTTDRRMIETLLSLFQHPEVFSIQREFGFDPRLANEKKLQRFLDDFKTIPQPELAPPNVYIEKIQGFVELQHLAPDDDRWSAITREFERYAPQNYQIAQKVATIVSCYCEYPVARGAHKKLTCFRAAVTAA